MDQDQQQFCVNVKMTMDMYQELSRQMTSLRVRQVSEHLRAHEMSLNHFSILHILQIEEEISSNQLANHLRLKAASITYLVDSLEKRGLVTRINNPDDRRSHYIRLTEAGRQLCSIPELYTEVEKKLETLDRSDLETLYLAMRLASGLLFR